MVRGRGAYLHVARTARVNLLPYSSGIRLASRNAGIVSAPVNVALPSVGVSQSPGMPTSTSVVMAPILAKQFSRLQAPPYSPPVSSGIPPSLQQKRITSSLIEEAWRQALQSHPSPHFVTTSSIGSGMASKLGSIAPRNAQSDRRTRLRRWPTAQPSMPTCRLRWRGGTWRAPFPCRCAQRS